MEFYIILCEPAVPENTGAAARAVKTMGMSGLRLVNPADHLSGKAMALAWASQDILTDAPVFTTLKDAVSDLDLIIGSTAKRRNVKQDYIHCAELPALLARKGDGVQRVGVVFGREDNGLTNDELDMCDIVSSVPMRTRYPSLNLAQAVMIYCYTLAPLAGVRRSRRKHKQPHPAKTASVKEKVIRLLTFIGYDTDGASYARTLERLATLSDQDNDLLISFLKTMSKNGFPG